MSFKTTLFKALERADEVVMEAGLVGTMVDEVRWTGDRVRLETSAGDEWEAFLDQEIEVNESGHAINVKCLRHNPSSEDYDDCVNLIFQIVEKRPLSAADLTNEESADA